MGMLQCTETLQYLTHLLSDSCNLELRGHCEMTSDLEATFSYLLVCSIYISFFCIVFFMFWLNLFLVIFKWGFSDCSVLGLGIVAALRLHSLASISFLSFLIFPFFIHQAELLVRARLSLRTCHQNTPTTVGKRIFRVFVSQKYWIRKHKVIYWNTTFKTY